MSESQTKPRMAEPRPQDFAPEGESFGRMAQPEQALMPAGQTLIQTQGAIITAQRVAVARDHNEIMHRLKVLAQLAGDRYIYSWNVKDRKTGRLVPVEGPTIKLANDLAREFGNCIVEPRVQEYPGYWLFYARFVDLETGYTLTRAFRQRRRQDTGMEDSERAEDIVFQIGQSKALRNVVVNSLTTYVDFMMEEAKKKLLDWVEKNAPKANTYIDGVLERFEISVQRVEATVGRPRSKWTVRDLAKVVAECRGIAENLTVAEEIYPEIDATAAPKADQAKKPAPPKKTEKAAPKKEAKKAKQPEPEPEPESDDSEPETEQEESEGPDESEAKQPAQNTADDDGGFDFE